MTRYLYCPKCGAAYKLHPQDALDGFRARVVKLPKAEKPKDHGLRINGEFMPLSELVCDACSDVIPSGSPAVAVTMWNTNREGTPGNWEHEFGTVGQ